jgi:hypothetical protein
MKKQDLYNKVKELLSINNVYRDNDRRLIARIWWDEMGGDKERISAKSMLNMYIHNELSQADSITRYSRQIQRLHPELRGGEYNKRHEEQEGVKSDLQKLSWQPNYIKCSNYSNHNEAEILNK